MYLASLFVAGLVIFGSLWLIYRGLFTDVSLALESKRNSSLPTYPLS